MNVYFDPATSRALDAHAVRAKVSKSAIVDAAVASFLSPDGADRREAAVTRRMDRMSRQLDRLERDQTVTIEALGLFVRAWFTATPALAESARSAANDRGRERYESFLQKLSERVQQGRSLAKEVVSDLQMEGAGSPSDL